MTSGVHLGCPFRLTVRSGGLFWCKIQRTERVQIFVCVHEEISEGKSEEEQLAVTVRLRPDPPLRYRKSSADVVCECSSTGGPFCLTTFGARSSQAHCRCELRRKRYMRPIVLDRHLVPAALIASVRRSHSEAGLFCLSPNVFD